MNDLLEDGLSVKVCSYQPGICHCLFFEGCVRMREREVPPCLTATAECQVWIRCRTMRQQLMKNVLLSAAAAPNTTFTLHFHSVFLSRLTTESAFYQQRTLTSCHYFWLYSERGCSLDYGYIANNNWS